MQKSIPLLAILLVGCVLGILIANRRKEGLTIRTSLPAMRLPAIKE